MRTRTFLLGLVVAFAVGYLVASFVEDGALLELAVSRGVDLLAKQGQYATFALILTLGFGWLSMWCINKLVAGKEEEIERLVSERDKFQKLFVDDWKSSKKRKG